MLNCYTKSQTAKTVPRGIKLYLAKIMRTVRNHSSRQNNIFMIFQIIHVDLSRKKKNNKYQQ